MSLHPLFRSILTAYGAPLPRKEEEKFACTRCNGMGWIRYGPAGRPISYPDCPKCGGTGVEKASV